MAKRRYVRRRAGRRLKGSIPVSMRGIGPRRRPVRAARRAGVRRRAVGVKRRFGPAGAMVRRVRRRADIVSGSYQFTRAKRTTGRFKSVSMLNRTLMKGGQEHVVYGWRAMKIFDNDGSLKLERQLYTVPGGSAATLPVYVMSLNGIQRLEQDHFPMYRLYTWADGVNDGKLFFTAVGGDNPSGATAEYGLQRMFDSAESTAGTFAGQSAVLRYIDLQMNLWGASGKSTRFTVQVIKVLSDSCDPWRLTRNGNQQTDVLNTEGQQAWQELIKQYTFNPLSKIDIHQAKKIKVLKTYDVVIQPNASTDGDPDPSCRTLKWFMKWDRLTKFNDIVQQNPGFQDDLQYMNNDQRPEFYTTSIGVTPASKSHLMLLIRATNYKGAYGSYSNGNDGSFDIDYKAKWTHLD